MFLSDTFKKWFVRIILIGSLIQFTTILLAPKYSGYERDYIQEYLLGAALLSDADVTTPVVLLAKSALELDLDTFLHTTPHPPTVGLFFLPLSILPFELSLVLWRILSVVFLVATVLETKKLSKNSGKALTPLVYGGFLLLSAGILTDLQQGQINIPKIYFEILSIRLLSQNKSVLSGIAVALAFCIKLGGWPLLLLFTLRKKFVAVGSSLAVISLLFLAVELLEPNFSTVNYFKDTISKNTSVYLQAHMNISIPGVVAKAFHGFETGEFISDPNLVDDKSNPLVVIACLFSLFCVAWKYKDKTGAGLLLLSLGTVVSPITWINNTLYIFLMLYLFTLNNGNLKIWHIFGLILLYRFDLLLNYYQSVWNQVSELNKEFIVHSLALFPLIFILISFSFFNFLTRQELLKPNPKKVTREN